MQGCRLKPVTGKTCRLFTRFLPAIIPIINLAKITESRSKSMLIQNFLNFVQDIISAAHTRPQSTKSLTITNATSSVLT